MDNIIGKSLINDKFRDKTNFNSEIKNQELRDDSLAEVGIKSRKNTN